MTLRPMAVSFYSIVVPAHDMPALARFWCQVLDWRVLYESDDEIVVGADEHAYPGLCFVAEGERKTAHNRLHIDLAPDDQEAEVERILALGARHADVGQGDDVSWVVLADPEGNEFCVLSPKKSLVE
ncbi:hypothetical protein GCM10010365_62800 [Streptomyces poonensis]|uniref:VOC domain-containing protein n=2 Tax=Streptomyces poonensis TaxID=68255 RepID=A0A918UTV7_9ACTN|nr:hypothetical protein GCM10010365_62800 [Streptomyces poonensis]